jgi:flagellar protein FlgJ
MRIDSAALPQPLSSAQPSATSGLGHAAEQFEAMFVGQMLRSVRESAEEDTDSDPGENSTFLELAEEQLAQALAARGGLGIATMVKTELGKTE